MFPVRDILLSIVLFGSVPVILAQPWLGPILWAWVSMMAPHRLTWAFAYAMPFAQVIAITTLVALVIARQRKAPPVTSVTTLLALFYVWMCITSVVALNQMGDVYTTWVKVTKIQLMLWVTIILLSGRKQINVLIWTIVLSIGYYGVKGGIWTLLTGGGERVWGPPGSFIEGNNELALALVVIIPFMYYLRTTTSKSWLRFGWIFAMLACMASVLGSHSRGALLALVAMVLFLGLKSHRPLLMTVVNVAAFAVLVAFMPENWTQRMETITTHEDHSAQSRLQTWAMIWNLVQHRPIGAGYDFWTPEVWAQYATQPWTLAYSPHSIYFQVLGEHGFLGLALYVGIGIATWRLASRMIRMSEKDPEMQWMHTLLRCVQVSLLSFAVGGAFLNLVNFDVPYYLAAITVLLWRDCRVQSSNAQPAPVASTSGVAGSKGALPATSRMQPYDERNTA